MNPASDHIGLSSLGGELHRAAAVLLDVHACVTDAAHDPSALSAELALVASLESTLRRMGSVLQSWSTDSAQASQRLTELEEEARAMGLTISADGLEPVPGPSRVDPAARERALPALARELERIRTLEQRHRHIAMSEAERSLVLLEQLSARARGVRPPN